jgi:hypothetical protein
VGATSAGSPSTPCCSPSLPMIGRGRPAQCSARSAGSSTARRHHLRAAVFATGVQMALTLVYWELMARSFDRRQP